MLKNSNMEERIVKGLAVVSFIAMCWVAHRTLQPRRDCVNSSFLSFVQIGSKRVPNCMMESRLSLKVLKTGGLTEEQSSNLRKLEILEPLNALIPEKRPRLAVEINLEDPKVFELGRNYVRIGIDWLNDPEQTRRALIMGVMHTRFPDTYTNQFQLEVITDFLMLSLFNADDWAAEDGESYSLAKDMTFATTAPSFDQYCQSPFRSLAHAGVCELSGTPEDNQGNVWGLRPLLAVSLWRVYMKMGIRDQLHMMHALRAGVSLPMVSALKNAAAENLVKWFRETLDEHVHVLVGKVDPKVVNRTLKELEVESPTKWELTMDVTNTPAWREIFEQMRRRTHVVKGERVLVFTPEGARALPSGLPVAWSADDISSQKHVMIACEWPQADEMVQIRARKMYARQTCDKISSPFWDN